MKIDKILEFKDNENYGNLLKILLEKTCVKLKDENFDDLIKMLTDLKNDPSKRNEEIIIKDETEENKNLRIIEEGDNFM